MEIISSKRTKDNIISVLKNEILKGNIKEGDELSQDTLASALGVSRMPIREALLELEKEGVLTRLPNRHMCVASLKDRNKTALCLARGFEIELSISLITDNRDLTLLYKSFENLFLNPSIEKELALHSFIFSLCPIECMAVFGNNIVSFSLTKLLSDNLNKQSNRIIILNVVLKSLLKKDKKNLISAWVDYYTTLGVEPY